MIVGDGINEKTYGGSSCAVAQMVEEVASIAPSLLYHNSLAKQHPYLYILIMLISSPEAMIALGTQLAQAGVTHILLYGDLGAGKTHFVKGYVAGCGLDPYLVQSPTYTYFHNYAGQILHMDMYRLEDTDYMIQKGMLQQMEEFDRVLIEWPKFIEMYGEGYTTVRIEKVSDTEREVTVV